MIRRVAATADDSDVRRELYPKIREQLLSHAHAEEKESDSTFRTKSASRATSSSSTRSVELSKLV